VIVNQLDAPTRYRLGLTLFDLSQSFFLTLDNDLA
jgi:hypothetical protein